MSLQGNEEIRAFMDKLTATTNVSKYIDLPMIAVMGDTSSGKSSLLSSLSAVELPSASELTTRCPIMLQMKRAEKKRALINVRWKHIPDGKVEKDIEFTSLTIDESEWETLPEAIEKAQKHIIDLSGKEVARDIVSVQVEGPHCEDLTVVDLPGIVRSRGKNEGENIVSDIKALIEDYLRNQRCVILAIVPANVDFHNSQIMADALEVDPDTKRTIPVITKPDLIDSGAEKDVLELLLGRKTQNFRMGFHMVKGRGQAELDANVTIDEGIEKEDSYFLNSQPWRDVNDREMFGTTQLRKKLGSLQLDMIRTSLPSIIEEIQQKVEKANTELSQLGDIPTSDNEKRIFFRRLYEKLVDQIRGMLTGKHRAGGNVLSANEETFAAKLQNECELFHDTLQASKFSKLSTIDIQVDVLVTLNSGEVIRGYVVGRDGNGGYYVDYQDRENVARDDLVAAWRQQDLSNPKKEKCETWLVSNLLNIADGEGGFDSLKAIPGDRVRRDPAWILPHIKRNRTDDLPIFVNQDVFRAIVIDFIDSEWEQPSENLVSKTKALLKKAMETALEESPELSHYPKLRAVLHRRLKDAVSATEDEIRTQVKGFIDNERQPYTQDHYLAENLAKLKFDEVFKQLGVALSLSSADGSSMQRAAMKTIIEAISKQNQEKSLDEHMVEDMQNALDAYGKVAMKRFIDCVPMKCWSMFREFPPKANTLFMELDDDDLRRHLVARDDVRRKYESLEVESRELKAGLDILESLY